MRAWGLDGTGCPAPTAAILTGGMTEWMDNEFGSLEAGGGTRTHAGLLVSPLFCGDLTKEERLSDLHHRDTGPLPKRMLQKKDIKREKENQGFSHFYRISSHNGFGNQGLGKFWHLGFSGDRSHTGSTGSSRGLLSRDKRGECEVMQARRGWAAEHHQRWGQSPGTPPPLCRLQLSPGAGHLAFPNLGLPVREDRSPLSPCFCED